MEPLANRVPSWDSAPWLLSPFEASVWKTVFVCESEIDFRVRLEDGSLLTEPRHASILTFMKRLHIGQTHLDFTGGFVYANSAVLSRVLSATHICEYFLARSEELQLARFGLAAFSESMAYRLLRDLAIWECSEAVYQWRDRLSVFLNEGAQKISDADYSCATVDRPDIAHVGPCPQLKLSASETSRACAWLWTMGYYRLASDGGGTTYILDSGKIATQLYPRGTLKSSWKKPRIRELELSHGPMLNREFPSVAIRGQKRSEAPLRFYVRAISVLPLLEGNGTSVPSGFSFAIRNKVFQEQLGLERVGRYRSLPPDVVLRTIRQSLEFALDYADDLIETYIRMIAFSRNNGLSLTESGRLISQFATPKLLSLGLKCWSISIELRKDRRFGLSTSAGDIEHRFFSSLRASEGLFELLQVLWGAVLLTVGAIMARRQGELVELEAYSFLDESETRLRFAPRKRNVANYRGSMLRPIPAVLVALLKKLQGMQRSLIELGVLTKEVRLFSFPRMHTAGLRLADDSSCNVLLDRFCDYFETPINENGCRIYIRQHQLRRFFAILFFWGNSYSGLDTLRWFLGHSDPEHLYRYISESTPGEILRDVKIDFVLERLRCNDPSTRQLVEALEKRFGTQSIQLMDSEELFDFIDSLLADSKLTVEPHFFLGLSGREYTIAIVVSEAKA